MKIKGQLSMLLYMKRIEQKTIASVLGKDQSTISRWLKNPTPKQTEAIMGAINQIEGGVHHDEIH